MTIDLSWPEPVRVRDAGVRCREQVYGARDSRNSVQEAEVGVHTARQSLHMHSILPTHVHLTLILLHRFSVCLFVDSYNNLVRVQDIAISTSISKTKASLYWNHPEV